MMKRILPLLLFCLTLGLASYAQPGDEQPVPRFEKRAVAETGVAVYLPKGASDFEVSKSEDGSEVYTVEEKVGDYNFASIVVHFVPEMDDTSPEELEALMESYLGFLQGQFGVTGAAGIGMGHRKEGLPDVRGAIDYWEDGDGVQYAVKAWIDRRFMGVMIIYGPDEYPYFNAQQMFFDGFRFPGE